MKLDIYFKNATGTELTSVGSIDLPDSISDIISENRNSMLENKFILKLVSELRLGEVIISPRGPR